MEFCYSHQYVQTFKTLRFLGNESLQWASISVFRHCRRCGRWSLLLWCSILLGSTTYVSLPRLWAIFLHICDILDGCENRNGESSSITSRRSFSTDKALYKFPWTFFRCHKVPLFPSTLDGCGSTTFL